MNLNGESIFAVVSCFLLYTFFIFVILYVINYDGFNRFFCKIWNILKRIVCFKKAKLDPAVEVNKSDSNAQFSLREKLLAPCARSKGLTKSKEVEDGVEAMIKYTPCASCKYAIWYQAKHGGTECHCKELGNTTISHIQLQDISKCSNFCGIRK